MSDVVAAVLIAAVVIPGVFVILTNTTKRRVK